MGVLVLVTNCNEPFLRIWIHETIIQNTHNIFVRTTLTEKDVLYILFKRKTNLTLIKIMLSDYFYRIKDIVEKIKEVSEWSCKKPTSDLYKRNHSQRLY